MKKDETEETTKAPFPLEGMKYNDRFQMVIGEFGREIVIRLNRGKARCSEDRKTITITYEDSKVRGPRKAKVSN